MKKIIKNRIRQFVRHIHPQLALDEKWERDRIGMDIDSRLYPLFRDIHQTAYRNLMRYPDLLNPINYNDRIHWLQLFDQSMQKVLISDKCAVRDYVASRVGEKYLTKLYGKFDSVPQMLKQIMPHSFVVKATHDCGSVVFVRHGDSLAMNDPRVRKLNRALHSVYGEGKGEWQYAHIRPCLMVEEYLDEASDTPPPDVKVHCVNGKASFIQYIQDRGMETKEAIFDRDWVQLPIHFDRNMIHLQRAPDRPDELDEMIWVSEKLSDGIKYVRVDLYNIRGRIVFGEMTLSPLAGCYKGFGAYQVAPLMMFDWHHGSLPISDGYQILS